MDVAKFSDFMLKLKNLTAKFKNMNRMHEAFNPYAHDRLENQEKKGKPVWFPGKKFAEKMETMKKGLEDCFKNGELHRESDLGKVIQEVNNQLEPGMKIGNLSMEEIEKLQEKLGGLAACFAPEAIKIGAEIFEQEKLH